MGPEDREITFSNPIADFIKSVVSHASGCKVRDKHNMFCKGSALQDFTRSENRRGLQRH